MSTSIRSFHRCNSTLSTDSSRYTISIHELRRRLRTEGHLRKCSASDLHLIENEDWWLNAFLVSYDYDIDVAFAVVLECLKWRHNFDVEHLSMLALKPLLDRKFMFVHGNDVERNSILWINLVSHRSGDKSSDQLFTYWLERHFVESHGGGLSLVVDMTGSSLKNMDFDFFKFILHSLKFYYPNTVQDMIVFETPSIMNASWKVIKGWLNAGHPQLHLVTRESVKQYIHSVYLPPHMGGDDQFVFTMDELARCIPSRGSPDEIAFATGDEEVRPNLDQFPVKRSVKFDDEDEEATRRAPLTMTRRSSKGPTKRSSSRSGMPSNLRPVAEKRVHAPDGDWVKSAFIAVSPRDELFLQKLEGDTDFVDIVAVRNTGEKNVMFKIKTTSPEKFRVRPSTGIVAAGSTESVRVYLQNEYRHSAGREKFLLMALETESTSIDQFTELWKASSSEKKVEQKLRCRVHLPDESDSGSNGKPERKISKAEQANQMDTLRDQVSQLANSQRMLLMFIAFLFVLQILVMYYEKSNSSALQAALEALQSQRVPEVVKEVVKEMSKETKDNYSSEL